MYLVVGFSGVRLDHHLHEPRERDLGLPAEPGAGLGRIADQQAISQSTQKSTWVHLDMIPAQFADPTAAKAEKLGGRSAIRCACASRGG